LEQTRALLHDFHPGWATHGDGPFGSIQAGGEDSFNAAIEGMTGTSIALGGAVTDSDTSALALACLNTSVLEPVKMAAELSASSSLKEQGALEDLLRLRYKAAVAKVFLKRRQDLLDKTSTIIGRYRPYSADEAMVMQLCGSLLL
jgi:hypothetical protein